MRIISFLTAILVTAFLYLLVFERDALSAVSRGAPLSTLLSAVMGNDPAPVNAQEPAEPSQESAQQDSPATEDDPIGEVLIKVVAVKSK